MAKGEDKTEDVDEPVQKPLLRLSTAVEKTDTVEIDGEEYQVLGFRHLSDDAEAEVMALLARYDRLTFDLSTTDDDRQAIVLAKRIRKKRIDILTRLTTIPASVVQKLPPSEQVKLVRAVQSAGAEDPDAGDIS